MSTNPISSISTCNDLAEGPTPVSANSINILSINDPSVNIIDGSRNNINTFNQITPRSRARNSQTSNLAQLQSIFPCQHPANPHMSSLGNRIQSFLQHMNTWVNSSRLQASIQELAAAGLYYIGKNSIYLSNLDDDNFMCIYCIYVPRLDRQLQRRQT